MVWVNGLRVGRWLIPVSGSMEFAYDTTSIITGVIDATPSVIDRVAASLPNAFPDELFDTITKGLRKAAAQLAGMPPK